MLQAYIDESGIHDGAQICCAAGYFGGVNQWKKFERQWKAILNREGIEEFHAKPFWDRDKSGRRVGVYRGWSEERANSFLNELISVIQGCNVYPVSAAVVTSDWNRLAHKERRYLTGAYLTNGRFSSTGAPGRPYFLAFAFCVLVAAGYCKPGLRVDYSFDLNHSLRGYSGDYFALLKRMNLSSYRLGEIAFPTSQDATPLQAADLLAFSSYRYSVKSLKSCNPLRHESVLAKIVQGMKDKRNDAKLFDRRGLDLVLEEFRKTHR